MAPCVGNVIDPSMYRHNWSCHEQIHLEIYAVSIFSFPRNRYTLNMD